MKNILNFINKNYIYIIFSITGLGVLGSLYFSNVELLPPCTLCWYQRILFYPIFILSAISIAFKEKLSPKFILALALPGLIIAAYQYGIQKLGIPEATFVTCQTGVPCDQVDWQILGFVTIPLLSFSGFLFLNIIALLKLRFSEENT